VSHEPPPLTPYRPELPHAVNAVMARALAKSPAERYATCQQFVAALQEAINSSPDPAVPYAEVPRQPGPVSGPTVAQLAAAGGGPITGANTWPPGGSGPHSIPGAGGPPGVSSVPPGAMYTQPTGEYRRRRRLPKGPLIGIAAVLVSLAVVAYLLLNPGGSPVAWRTFPGDVAAPFTFEHPGDWATRVHGDQYVVVSPAAAEFEALFSVPISGDWAAAAPVLNGEDPGRATGLMAQVNNTLDVSDVQNLQDSLRSALPGSVGYGTEPTAATVGGRPGFRVTGTINDPQQNGRLDFVAYLVRRDQGQPTALFTFFCAPGRCDNATIDRVIGSVSFR